jgi:hypothetical protein
LRGIRVGFPSAIMTQSVCLLSRQVFAFFARWTAAFERILLKIG